MEEMLTGEDLRIQRDTEKFTQEIQDQVDQEEEEKVRKGEAFIEAVNGSLISEEERAEIKAEVREMFRARMNGIFEEPDKKKIYEEPDFRGIWGQDEE